MSKQNLLKSTLSLSVCYIHVPSVILQLLIEHIIMTGHQPVHNSDVWYIARRQSKPVTTCVDTAASKEETGVQLP